MALGLRAITCKRLASRLYLVLLLLACVSLSAQTYDLPNDDNDCPANCRKIPWLAGSDVWNGGTLPNYSSVTCGGLAGNGSTNDGPAIQSCINSAAANTAVFLPAGTYLLNTNLVLRSNVVLRGAGATLTALKLGSSGAISFSRGDTLGSNIAISSGYTKGSTQIVMSSGSW